MKVKIKIKKEVDLKYLQVEAGVRYWEDSSVNGVEDKDGTLIPCRNGDTWEPLIDIDHGIITNWEGGKSASIHYKVCDDGRYKLLDEDGNTLITKDMYVPECLCIGDNGFGDYIIMNISENGTIQGWNTQKVNQLIKAKSF